MGVAPPVSDDWAPTASTLDAARTMAGISEMLRGMEIPAAWPPGK